MIVKHLKIGDTHVHPIDQLERVSFHPEKKILTVVTPTEGQRDFSGPEAEAAWIDYQKHVNAPDPQEAILDELRAIRVLMEKAVGTPRAAVQELPPTQQS